MSNYYAVPATIFVWAEDESEALERAGLYAAETENPSEGISVGAGREKAELIEEGDEEGAQQS